ncbi:pilin [Amycolatopsis methanolica]|uniref:pilin n=1 Tax=Amycolatopsis methanolica TaxID=1814 RepID=UPI0034478B3B
MRLTRTPRPRNRRRRTLLLAKLVALTLLTSRVNAHADTVVLALAASVEEVLNNIRNWLMGILAGLATVFLTIGGVRRVFGGGDPGEQEKAKEAFKAAGIGYVLAALAPLVVEVLKGIVGA